MALQDGVVDQSLGDALLGQALPGEGVVTGVSSTDVQLIGLMHDGAGSGRSNGVILGTEHGAVVEAHGVHAGLAQTLHAQNAALDTGNFVGVGTTDVGAAETVNDGGDLVGPVLGQSLDDTGGNAALGGCPLGSLGDAVFLTQNVVGELLEAHGVSLQVLLVVGAGDQPLIGNSQMQGGVGVGQDGDPLVSEHGSAVVQVGADVDGLDADVTIEQAETADLVTGAETTGGGAGVAGLVQQQFAVLGHVGVQVGAVGHQAERLAAPEMLGAPEPALPGVGVTDLHGEATQQVQQLEHTAVGAVDHLGLAVAVALSIDSIGAVSIDDAADLALDDIQSLIPGDALVAGDTTVLGITLAVGIPVHTLDGVQDTVGRVNALLPGDTHGAAGSLGGGFQHLAAGLDAPGVDVLVGVLPIVTEGANTQDLAVLHVNRSNVRAVTESRVARGSECGKDLLFIGHCGYLSFFVVWVSV